MWIKSRLGLAGFVLGSVDRIKIDWKMRNGECLEGIRIVFWRLNLRIQPQAITIFYGHAIAKLHNMDSLDRWKKSQERFHWPHSLKYDFSFETFNIIMRIWTSFMNFYIIFRLLSLKHGNVNRNRKQRGSVETGNDRGWTRICMWRGKYGNIYMMFDRAALLLCHVTCWWNYSCFTDAFRFKF